MVFWKLFVSYIYLFLIMINNRFWFLCGLLLCMGALFFIIKCKWLNWYTMSVDNNNNKQLYVQMCVRFVQKHATLFLFC